MGPIIEPNLDRRRSSAVVPGKGSPHLPGWLPAALVLLGTGWGSNQITPLLIVYGRRLALSTATLEAMFGVYALGLIPGLLLAGPVSDARGRRSVAIPAAGLSLVATGALIAGSHDVALLFAGRFLAGVGSGAAFGSGTAWVRELSRPPFGQAGDHAAARRAANAMTLGFGLGPLVAGMLAQWAPLPAVVPYLPHVALMVVVLLALRGAPETVAHDHRRAIALAVPEVRNPRFRRVVVPLAPWVFAAPAIAFALLPSVVGAQHTADGIALVAAVTALCAAAGVLVQPLARRLDSGRAGHRAATAGLAMLVAGLVLGAVTTGAKAVWLLVPCALVLGAAYGVCLVAGLVETARLAGPGTLARATAAYYTLTYVGFAAPYLLALGANLTSYPILLSSTAGLAIITLLAVRRASSLTLTGR